MTALLLSAADPDDSFRIFAAVVWVASFVVSLLVAYAVIKAAVLAALKENDRQRRKAEEKAGAERARQY